MQLLSGMYDHRMTALAVSIAALAAYTAFLMAGRVQNADGGARSAWMIAGAFALGTGLWAMHFVGLLAVDWPFTAGFDVAPTVGSWALGVGGSAVALFMADRGVPSAARVLVGAGVISLSVLLMHHVGLYAIRFEPALIHDPLWVALALFVGILSAAASLWVAFSPSVQARIGLPGARLIAAAILTLSFAGVHFVSMRAISIPDNAVGTGSMSIDPLWLASFIACATVLMLGIAATAAAFERRLEKHTAQLSESLDQAALDLEYASRHDPLTELANRNLLQERVEEAIDEYQAGELPFALVYIDLDGFKIINDSLGHHIGDQLLRGTAEAILACTRHSDTVSRIGGDEFVVLLRDVANQSAVTHVCNKLLESLCEGPDSKTQLSASIGSSMCPEDGLEFSALITAADIAMCAAKNRGKHCYQPYQGNMGADMLREFEIQEDLRRAIAEGELCVYYQPKFSTKARKLVGAEALVRWPHPEKGMIQPDEFIGIAERSGLINGLEMYVLDAVCKQIRNWLDMGLEVPAVSVNLSAVRIRDEQLPYSTQQSLDKYNLDPNYIVFEITESLAISEIMRAIEALKGFSAMGVHVALDDFGTGYSSLSYLKQLPIQQVKIDRSFIRDLDETASDHFEIVRAIIQLAHALRLKVIAEGVETEQQMRFLGELDCDEVQGYLLSRPVSAEAFLEIIRESMSVPGSAQIHVFPRFGEHKE